MRQGKIALALACACITTAPAAASMAPAGTAKLDPSTAGAGAHLLLDAQGPDGGGFHKQEIPGGLALSFNKGFTFDPAAVGGVCSDDQANKGQCPPNSIVGTGLLDVLAEGFAFGANGTQYTAQLTFFRAAPRQAGDPMGIVFYFFVKVDSSTNYSGATVGRVLTLDDPILGTQIQWDKLPIPPLPPGLHFTLERLRIDLGAGAATPPVRVKPAVKNCRKVRIHGKTYYRCHRKVKGWHCRKSGKHYLCRKPRAHSAQDGGAFLTNPTTCTGTWRIRLELAYPSGNEVRDADAPCTAAR
jgi:hypothetical protein